jgi:hypothetical protein
MKTCVVNGMKLIRANMGMILRSIAFVLMLCTAAGCATGQCPMISFAPRDRNDARSENEVLAHFNSRVPFRVDVSNFAANCAHGERTYWIMLSDRRQERLALAMLEKSSDLRFLSVGYALPEFRQAFGMGKKTLATRSVVQTNVVADAVATELALRLRPDRGESEASYLDVGIDDPPDETLAPSVADLGRIPPSARIP